MVGLTLSAEQIRKAPPEVRRWLEHELLASLGLLAPAAEPSAPQLVECSAEEARRVLSLIHGMIPVVNVFFELGREGAKTDIEGLEAFRLDDILRHTRLQTPEQLIACLSRINEAVSQVRADPDAMFYALDRRGYCFITARTQQSIACVWQEMVPTRSFEPAALRSPLGMPPLVLPTADASVPSCPIASAPSAPPERGGAEMSFAAPSASTD